MQKNDVGDQSKVFFFVIKYSADNNIIMIIIIIIRRNIIIITILFNFKNMYIMNRTFEVRIKHYVILSII